MNTTSTQFVPSRRMGLCEPMPQIGMWGDYKDNNSCLDVSPQVILEIDSRFDNQSEDTSHGTVGPSDKYDQEARKPTDKVRRRLAQNREAARKCRLRKKAYVQQLETSKLRLIQLERELERARQQGLYVGGGVDTGQLGYSAATNPGIATFEMAYAHWLEEQTKKMATLKNALYNEVRNAELSSYVDDCFKHYYQLFAMKEAAAKVDVFYLLSGTWKTTAEHFLSWIGGFRPSELLKVLIPHLGLLTEQQNVELRNLRESCHQAEDALSQGLERLHTFLSEAVATPPLDGNFRPHIGNAIEKLKAMVRFVGQADHLRKETLTQISRILTDHQAARGLLVLGEYFQRLRTLSSVWASRPRESA